ncbi:MAG: hypothetical protein PVJ57_09720 [Phycisphaerae bacterium]
MALTPENKAEAGRRSSRRWGGLVLLAVAVPAVAIATWVVLAGREEAAVLSQLRDRRPGERSLGAWKTAEGQFPRAIEYIAEQLTAGREADARARESFVQTLGSAGRTGDFPLVARLACSDDIGAVRQAAWLAAARIDPTRFAELAAAQPAAEDPWDQIGLARGWLQIGDPRGVETLLHWARAGDKDQQHAASAALTLGLVPLLQLCGQWPAGVAVKESTVWSAELLDGVGRRCAAVDLRGVAERAGPHRAAAARLERDTSRMASAQGWVAKFLFSF